MVYSVSYSAFLRVTLANIVLKSYYGAFGGHLDDSIRDVVLDVPLQRIWPRHPQPHIFGGLAWYKLTSINLLVHIAVQLTASKHTLATGIFRNSSVLVQYIGRIIIRPL